MATNKYFNNFPSQNRFNNEHMLLEDVIVESIEMMGHNVYYILRESLDTIDYIFGEESKVKLKNAFLIEAYIANVEGFEGDGDFFSKFGLEIRDTSNFILSRRSFAKNIPSSLRQRPQEGDLVYVPLMNRVFEIKFIEKKLLFFSLGNRHPFIYEMRCEDFRYSQEQIETGITDIDSIEEQNSYTQRLQLSTTGTGSFENGETVYQGASLATATSTAEVKDWYAANGSMFIFGITGTFNSNTTLHGATTGAAYTVTSIDDEETDYVTNDFYNNRNFKDDNTLILDLSELNPFGTP